MHAVFKWRWYGFLIAISVIGLLVRFWVIARFEFIADNGTEFYVMQQMKSGTCWPLVGPLIGVEHLYIPPTYFYILYSLQQLLSDPATIVYAFAVINILAILFLGLAISVATNRSTAVVVLLLAHCTYALFTEGTYIWHPQPVSIFFSFGLWMLLLAGKKQNILYVYTGLVSYFLALSIHPSSLPLLPFFVYHVVFFFRQRTSQWMNVLLHTFWLMVVSAIPIYATQILFEYLNGFPTIVTLFLRAPDTSQSAFVAAHFSIENIISILRYFVTRTIGLTHSITGSFWELIFLVIDGWHGYSCCNN